MFIDGGLDVKGYALITIICKKKTHHFAVPSLFYAVLTIYLLIYN